MNGVAAGPDLIIEAGELDNKSIVIVLEEGFGFQASCKDGLQVPVGLLVVFLDDLLEAGVIELGKLGKIVDIGDDVAQILL